MAIKTTVKELNDALPHFVRLLRLPRSPAPLTWRLRRMFEKITVATSAYGEAVSHAWKTHGELSADGQQYMLKTPEATKAFNQDLTKLNKAAAESKVEIEEDPLSVANDLKDLDEKPFDVDGATMIGLGPLVIE